MHPLYPITNSLTILAPHLQHLRWTAGAEGRELLLELGDERRLVVALNAQLLLDALELLQQEVAPLVSLDLLLHLLANVRLQKKGRTSMASPMNKKLCRTFWVLWLLLKSTANRPGSSLPPSFQMSPATNPHTLDNVSMRSTLLSKFCGLWLPSYIAQLVALDLLPHVPADVRLRKDRNVT